MLGLRRRGIGGRRAAIVATVATALVTLAGPARAGSSAPAPVVKLKVMTQNLYLGADLAPGFEATTAEEFLAAVDTEFRQVQQTNFPERAQALAAEVAANGPDVIGLQEVALWRSQTPADFSPIPDATNVEYDFLPILLDALSARGLSYAQVASVTDTDVEAPRVFAGSPNGYEDIRLTLRDVMLARSDQPASQFATANPQSGNFSTNLTLTTPEFSITILRGWVSVDATLKGKTVRVVSSHLESLYDPVNEAQGAELLQGPGNTSLPVVFVGDFNSVAVSGSTYHDYVAAGLGDSWAEAHPTDPGYSCCEAADLLNAAAALDQRIDYVWFRGAFGVGAATLIGASPSDKTQSGLWPSDHAGLVVKLQLP